MRASGISNMQREIWLTGSFRCLSPPSSALSLGNEIGDNGARSLAEALKRNTALTTLNLNSKSERELRGMLLLGISNMQRGISADWLFSSSFLGLLIR